MTLLPLLAVGILMKFVGVLFMMVCAVLILVILIQKGRGGGLSGAFGGGMASGLLGSKTGDFLTWVTIGLVAVFLGLAVLMAKFYRPGVSDFDAQVQPPAPTSSTTPAPTPTTQPAPTGAAQPAPTQPSAPATQPNTAAPGAQPPAQGTGSGGTGGQ